MFSIRKMFYKKKNLKNHFFNVNNIRIANKGSLL